MNNKIKALCVIFMFLLSSIGVVAAGPIRGPTSSEDIQVVTEPESSEKEIHETQVDPKNYTDIMNKNTLYEKLDVSKDYANNEGYQESLKYSPDKTREYEETEKKKLKYDQNTQKLEPTGEYKQFETNHKQLNVTHKNEVRKQVGNRTVYKKDDMNSKGYKGSEIDRVVLSDGTVLRFEDNKKLASATPNEKYVEATLYLNNGIIRDIVILNNGNNAYQNYGLKEQEPLYENVTYVDTIVYHVREFIVVPLFKIVNIIIPPDPVNPDGPVNPGPNDPVNPDGPVNPGPNGPVNPKDPIGHNDPKDPKKTVHAKNLTKQGQKEKNIVFGRNTKNVSDEIKDINANEFKCT